MYYIVVICWATQSKYVKLIQRLPYEWYEWYEMALKWHWNDIEMSLLSFRKRASGDVVVLAVVVPVMELVKEDVVVAEVSVLVTVVAVVVLTIRLQSMHRRTLQALWYSVIIGITFLQRENRARNVKNHISASNSVQFLKVNQSVCAWANHNMVQGYNRDCCLLVRFLHSIIFYMYIQCYLNMQFQVDGGTWRNLSCPCRPPSRWGRRFAHDSRVQQDPTQCDAMRFPISASSEFLSKKHVLGRFWILIWILTFFYKKKNRSGLCTTRHPENRGAQRPPGRCPDNQQQWGSLGCFTFPDENRYLMKPHGYPNTAPKNG